MALEDLAMFQSLPGCTVFYPSDAVAMERAVELAASTRGITFLRAGRPQVSSLALSDCVYYYPKFCIGFKIRKSRSEQLLLSGLGHSK